jgi:hypothetical protein
MMHPKRNYAGAEVRMHDCVRDLGSWTITPANQHISTAPALLPRKPTLEQIWRLEDAIAASGAAMDTDTLTQHHFAEGLYGRELFIPAGTVLTGKMHKHGQINVLAQGSIEVWTEGGMKRLDAPCVIASLPGTKRVGYAYTDVVWVTVSATEETDLVALEAQLIEPEGPLRIAAGLKALTTDGE